MRKIASVLLTLVLSLSLGLSNSFAFSASVEAGAAGSRKVLKVGQGREYKTVSAAIKEAKDGSIIEIDAGFYADDVVVVSQDDITLKGINGYAHFDWSAGTIPNGKGILLQRGNNLTVEWLEFSGAKVKDRNGAGIRLDGGANLTVRDCYFHNNENGILTGENKTSIILIENSHFDSNGYGDGQSHNIYIGRVAKFTLRGSYSHRSNIGHNVKSRALENYILYNRIMDEDDGTSSSAIDLPDGGESYIIGNLLQQGPKTANHDRIIGYGLERKWSPSRELYLVNNTIVNDFPAGNFVHADPGTEVFVSINNLYVGHGRTYRGKHPTSDAHNLREVFDPGFSNRYRYDYSLKASAVRAIDRGINPGFANNFSLLPQHQYVHPVGLVPRKLQRNIDVGAYEFWAVQTSRPFLLHPF